MTPVAVSSSLLTEVNAVLSRRACNACLIKAEMEFSMKAIVDLFSTDYGLFSISGIVFMIGMAIWFYRFFNRKMDEAERAQRAKA
jgi:Protein of unknown function (DUF3149)